MQVFCHTVRSLVYVSILLCSKNAWICKYSETRLRILLYVSILLYGKNTLLWKCSAILKEYLDVQLFNGKNTCIFKNSDKNIWISKMNLKFKKAYKHHYWWKINVDTSTIFSQKFFRLSLFLQNFSTELRDMRNIRKKNNVSLNCTKFATFCIIYRKKLNFNYQM